MIINIAILMTSSFMFLTMFLFKYANGTATPPKNFPVRFNFMNILYVIKIILKLGQFIIFFELLVRVVDIAYSELE